MMDGKQTINKWHSQPKQGGIYTWGKCSTVQTCNVKQHFIPYWTYFTCIVKCWRITYYAGYDIIRLKYRVHMRVVGFTKCTVTFCSSSITAKLPSKARNVTKPLDIICEILYHGWESFTWVWITKVLMELQEWS